MDGMQPESGRVGLLSSTQSFLDGVKLLYVDGDWSHAQDGQTFSVENPATGAKLAEVAKAGKADVDRAVLAARRAFETWSTMPPIARSRLMLKLADAIDEHAEELAQLESLDGGKPIQITRTLDVPFTGEIFRYNAGWVGRIGGETVTPYMQEAPFHAFTMKEPVGVVAGIVPWNFPIIQAAVKVSSALAAGCVIILKPAEQTPLTAIRLAEIAHEVGIPPGVFQVLNGFGREVGADLVAHRGIDKITFTGSTGVGRELVRNVASDFKRVTLELGGKSPNVIFDDADLDIAIPGAVQGCFLNTGQVCHAGTRLYVQRGIYDAVVDGVAQGAAALPMGDPLDASTFLGPLVSQTQLDRVAGYIEAGKGEGAVVAAGGVALDRPGYFMPPTVLTETRLDMSVVQEEIFGPVICAIPFDTEDDLIQMANGVDYGLAAGIWTQNLSRAHRVSRRIKAGSVWVNAYHVADPAMPFGGFKQSGWGRELGKAGIEAFTEPKSVAMNLA